MAEGALLSDDAKDPANKDAPSLTQYMRNIANKHPVAYFKALAETYSSGNPYAILTESTVEIAYAFHSVADVKAAMLDAGMTPKQIRQLETMMPDVGYDETLDRLLDHALAAFKCPCAVFPYQKQDTDEGGHTRTGLSSSIQSSKHSGNSLLCPRSVPSTKRLIRSLRKSRRNHIAENQMNRRVFTPDQGHSRPSHLAPAAEQCLLCADCVAKLKNELQRQNFAAHPSEWIFGDAMARKELTKTLG